MRQTIVVIALVLGFAMSLFALDESELMAQREVYVNRFQQVNQRIQEAQSLPAQAERLRGAIVAIDELLEKEKSKDVKALDE